MTDTHTIAKADQTPRNTWILSLEEIAWWWLGDALPNPTSRNRKRIWADLPVIQRGFVWHANKIERLWDSIATGFPIGSLMLHDKEADKEMAAKYGSDASIDALRNRIDIPHYFLLDGQQRATAIALGFKDVWTQAPRDTTVAETRSESWRALWVDIEQLPKDDRRFLFRLTSNAHPWGYGKDAKATSTPTRLSAYQMRSALDAFQIIICCEQNIESHGNAKLKPHEVPAHVAYPWDAVAPIPLPFLLHAILEEPSYAKTTTIRDRLLAKIRSIPAVKYLEGCSEKQKLDSAPRKTFSNVIDILTSDAGDPRLQIFNELTNNLRRALNEAEVPAPVLKLNNKDEPHVHQVIKPDEQDPDFNLFARINTAGTPLTAEEINYSLLKSVWREASSVVDELLKDYQFTYPARLVSLMVRLVLTDQSIGKEKSVFQDKLTIAQFRQSVPTVHEILASPNTIRKMQELVNIVWNLLCGEDLQRSWTLPKVLAVDITRGSEDLMLVLLLWLYALQKKGIRQISQIPEEIQREVLGFITTVHWFANKSDFCARILGKELVRLLNEGEEGESDPNHLFHFFNSERFHLLLKSGDKSIPMRAIPDPKEFHDKVFHSKEKEPAEPHLWHIYFVGQDDNISIDYRVFEKLMIDRRLLIYAQRSFMRQAFSWFDPTRIDRITDHNVPWDFDHIVPYSWLNSRNNDLGKNPNRTKIWRESNGNYRVWPAEANRSKSDTTILENDLSDYYLADLNDICMASFILDSSWFKKNARMTKSEITLRGFDEFVVAAMERTTEIYGEWYDSLRVAQIVKQDSTKEASDDDQ